MRSAQQFCPRAAAGLLDPIHYLDCGIALSSFDGLEIGATDAHLFGKHLLGHFQDHAAAIDALAERFQVHLPLSCPFCLFRRAKYSELFDDDEYYFG